MLNPQALQLRVDVGSQCHSVAVGLTDGSLLEEFESNIRSHSLRASSVRPNSTRANGLLSRTDHIKFGSVADISTQGKIGERRIGFLEILSQPTIFVFLGHCCPVN